MWNIIDLYAIKWLRIILRINGFDYTTWIRQWMAAQFGMYSGVFIMYSFKLTPVLISYTHSCKFKIKALLNGSRPRTLITYILDKNNHDDVINWKHFPSYWFFVRGIHRSPVNSPHKGQWRGALIFSLICAWINGWLNNRDAGDLRRHGAHYDVTVIIANHDTEQRRYKSWSIDYLSAHKTENRELSCCQINDHRRLCWLS